MPDMDVIVKSLKRCSDMTICPDDCSYRKYAPDCVERLHKDAINLLKDQNELLKQQDELLEVKDERIKNLEHKLKEQERKKGHWIDYYNDDCLLAYKCSECHMDALTRYETLYDAETSDFCPFCGADMRGEQDA